MHDLMLRSDSDGSLRFLQSFGGALHQLLTLGSEQPKVRWIGCSFPATEAQVQLQVLVVCDVSLRAVSWRLTWVKTRPGAATRAFVQEVYVATHELPHRPTRPSTLRSRHQGLLRGPCLWARTQWMNLGLRGSEIDAEVLMRDFRVVELEDERRKCNVKQESSRRRDGMRRPVLL